MKLSHRLQIFFLRYPWILIAIALAGFFLLSISVLYHFEKVANPDLTFFDTFGLVLVYFLGEYGDTPKTEIGRGVSLLVFLVGIIIVATIIGKITSLFVKLKLEVKMPKTLESHFLICNWNIRGDRIVKEIHSPLGSPETEIIVVTEKEVNEAELRANPEYERVYFIKSDPTLHDVLKRARAHLAKSVIILADTEWSDPDAKTALIALAITKLEKDLPEKPYIVAEVVNHRKIQHLYDAGVDEWVCSTDYGLGIIAQCALYKKLSIVYQELLTYSEETNEIYIIESTQYPPDFSGKTFAEISKILIHYRDGLNPVILVGIKRDEQVLLNPRSGDFDKCKKGDSLIVMAYDRPDLRKLENR